MNEYTVIARLFCNGKLYGYRLVNNSNQTIPFDVNPDAFKALVQNNCVYKCKVSGESVTGYGGFELRSLPTLVLNPKIEIIAELFIGAILRVGYVGRNISSNNYIYGPEPIKPGGLILLTTRDLRAVEKDLANAITEQFNSIYNEKFSLIRLTNGNKLPIIDISVYDKNTDKYYIRKPYISFGGLITLLGYYTDISDKVVYNFLTPYKNNISASEVKNIFKENERSLLEDIKTGGQVGNTLKEAMVANNIMEETIEKQEKQKKQERQEKQVKTHDINGFKGILNLFKR